MRIWKHLLPLQDTVTVAMPHGRVLVAEAQFDLPCLWVEHTGPEDGPTVDRTFHIIGTGQEFDSTGKLYLGTVQTHGGALVWHIYEDEPF